MALTVESGLGLGAAEKYPRGAKTGPVFPPDRIGQPLVGAHGFEHAVERKDAVHDDQGRKIRVVHHAADMAQHDFGLVDVALLDKIDRTGELVVDHGQFRPGR